MALCESRADGDGEAADAIDVTDTHTPSPSKPPFPISLVARTHYGSSMLGSKSTMMGHLFLGLFVAGGISRLLSPDRAARQRCRVTRPCLPSEGAWPNSGDRSRRRWSRRCSLPLQAAVVMTTLLSTTATAPLISRLPQTLPGGGLNTRRDDFSPRQASNCSDG